jgi:hypothetical protein
MVVTETFGCISDIQSDAPLTWENKIFITFDIDWAHDDVLSDTIDVMERADVVAIWFVTHDTPLLERLRANPKFELGIHPNFNFLLAGDPRKGATASEVIDRLIEIVPEAKVVRSHSTTQSSRLLDIFADRGLTHDCNHFVPEQAAIELKPYDCWSSLIKVPYFWEDAAVCMSEVNTPIAQLANRPGLRVFNFHPIHVYLNTEKLSRYEQARSNFKNPSALQKLRNQDSNGTRSRLKELLGLKRQE